MKYGPLYGGSMKLKVEKDTIIGDDSCFFFKSILESNRDLRFLFEVHDTIISIVRKRDFSTLIYGEFIHEKNYKRENIYNFVDSSFSEPIYDMLSIFFLFSHGNKNLKIKDTVRILSGDKIYRFYIFPESYKKVSTFIGKFNTVVFAPDVKGEKGFGRKGKLRIYYNLEKPHIPVKIKTYMFIGAIEATLRWIKKPAS